MSFGKIRLGAVAALVLAQALFLPTARAEILGNGFGGFAGPPPTTPYLAADGSFALKVPASWAVKENKAEPDKVTLRALAARDAFVEVRRVQVSENARPKQMVLRAKETRLGKLPHYKEILTREMNVSGAPAASIIGTYWYQGNAQFPRAVEEVFVVFGTEGFMFHFECFEPMLQALAPDVNGIYLSFVPHPAPAAPLTSSPSDEGDIWDNLPF